MKRFLLATAMAMTVVAGPAHAQLNFDPNQVAILRWYKADQATSFFLVGNPVAVAFDGACIWAVSVNANNVTKLRANDGTILGTFSVGLAPRGLAYDGANMWVANSGDNTVTALDGLGGVFVTVPVGNAPFGVAFDGATFG